MTNKEIIKEKLKHFEDSCKFYCNYHKVGEMETVRICGNLEQVVIKALSDQRKEIIEEMIKLSDDIELEEGTPDINEWRAFKLFRDLTTEVKVVF